MGHTVAEGPYQVTTRVCSVFRHVLRPSRSHPRNILFGASLSLHRVSKDRREIGSYSDGRGYMDFPIGRG